MSSKYDSDTFDLLFVCVYLSLPASALDNGAAITPPMGYNSYMSGGMGGGGEFLSHWSQTSFVIPP